MRAAHTSVFRRRLVRIQDLICIAVADIGYRLRIVHDFSVQVDFSQVGSVGHKQYRASVALSAIAGAATHPYEALLWINDAPVGGNGAAGTYAFLNLVLQSRKILRKNQVRRVTFQYPVDFGTARPQSVAQRRRQKQRCEAITFDLEYCLVVRRRFHQIIQFFIRQFHAPPRFLSILTDRTRADRTLRQSLGFFP